MGHKNFRSVIVALYWQYFQKLHGISDTPALMAIKAHLRTKPVVIGVSTNDGLGMNAKILAS